MAAWLLGLQQSFALLGRPEGFLSLPCAALGFSSEAAGYQEEGGTLQMGCGAGDEGLYVDTCLQDTGLGRWILFSLYPPGPIW